MKVWGWQYYLLTDSVIQSCCLTCHNETSVQWVWQHHVALISSYTIQLSNMSHVRCYTLDWSVEVELTTLSLKVHCSNDITLNEAIYCLHVTWHWGEANHFPKYHHHAVHMPHAWCAVDGKGRQTHVVVIRSTLLLWKKILTHECLKAVKMPLLYMTLKRNSTRSMFLDQIVYAGQYDFERWN